MTDTLTYDPTEADAPELTPDEQDSLEVGEQLAEQQEELLEILSFLFLGVVGIIALFGIVYIFMNI